MNDLFSCGHGAKPFNQFARIAFRHEVSILGNLWSKKKFLRKEADLFVQEHQHGSRFTALVKWQFPMTHNESKLETKGMDFLMATT